METVTCFISYSHDSKAHKDWVRNLAKILQTKGIHTYLDQWDLFGGSEALDYMESKVRESDYVLLVCTPEFAGKANQVKGGVGWEKRIITGEMYERDSTPGKFIPILREGDQKTSLPSYLKSKIFIDFRKDEKFDEGFEELYESIFKIRKHGRPPLGNVSDPVSRKPSDLNMMDGKMGKIALAHTPKLEPEKKINQPESLHDKGFLYQYKKEFYDLLKQKEFIKNGDNLHRRIYRHKDGEELQLIVDEENIFDKNKNSHEYVFVFKREYIYFRKKKRKQYKKIVKISTSKISMKSTFNCKRIELESIMEEMEDHIKISESEIEAKCRKEDLKIILYPILAFVGMILFSIAIIFIFG